MQKHDRRYGTVCRVLFDNIPSQLMTHNSRFSISSTAYKRANQIADSLLDIEMPKIAGICYECAEPMPGLELSKRIGYFKVYPSDSGLLVSSIYKETGLNAEEAYRRIIFSRFNSNFGKIFESLVMQSLVSAGFHPFYHTYEMARDGRTSRYEIDFMVERKGRILAIEVKSGLNFTISSLDNMKAKYPQLKFDRCLISNKPFSVSEHFLSLPIYMAFCLQS